MRKTCTKCGQTKDLEDFGKAKRYAMGRKSWCKQCMKEYQSNYHAAEGYDKAYKEKNRKHLNKITRDWYKRTDRYTTHGKHYVKKYRQEHPLSVIYRNMKAQCYNPNYMTYENFGARGIKCCKAWEATNGFQIFEKWAMENGYKKGLVLSRKSIKRNFSPSNCVFITQKESSRNRLNGNAMYTYMGETKCITAWSEDKRCVVALGTLSNRINAYGWRFDEALTTPPMKHGKRRK